MQPFRHPILLAAGIITAAPLLPAEAQETDPSGLMEYDWRARLHGSVETGRVYRAVLPLDVYDGCLAFPLDLVVADEDGVVFPSIVWPHQSREAVEPLRVRAIGGVVENAERGFHVAEFQVEPLRPGATTIHNRVIINLGGPGHVRRAEVWGGPDREHLVLLGSDFLVEQKEPFPVRDRTIDYPDSDAMVVAIRIFADERRPGTPPEWRATEVTHVTRDSRDQEAQELEIVDPPADHAGRPGVAMLYLDAGARNRPLLFMDIRCRTENFAMPVRVFGRNDPTNTWRWAADGGIHDLGGRKQSRVAMSRADYRYLKIEFYHYEQEPPRVREVTGYALPHYLVFTAKSDRRAYAYFGSTRYRLPMNDLSVRVGRGMMDETAEASLGKRHVNPVRVASSLHHYGRTLMTLGGGILLLFIAIVAVRIARHRLAS